MNLLDAAFRFHIKPTLGLAFGLLSICALSVRAQQPTVVQLQLPVVEQKAQAKNLWETNDDAAAIQMGTARLPTGSSGSKKSPPSGASLNLPQIINRPWDPWADEQEGPRSKAQPAATDAHRQMQGARPEKANSPSMGRGTLASAQDTLADLALPDNLSVPSQVEALPAPPRKQGSNSSEQKDAMQSRLDDALLAIPETGEGESARTNLPSPLKPEAVVPIEQSKPNNRKEENSHQDYLDSALNALPSELLLAPKRPNPGEPTRSEGNNSNSDSATKSKGLKAPKYDGSPIFIESYGKVTGPRVDTLATQVPYDPHAFAPTLVRPSPYDPRSESLIYRGKHEVPTQRPIIELGRPLFAPGTFPPGIEWLGRYNLIMPHFMVYGDFRTGLGVNRNTSGEANSLAFRSNLDMDLEITATERLHAFISPLDRNGDFTRLDFTNSTEFVDRSDLRLDTLFFEGDVGALWGGLSDQDSPFDLPFSFGLIPFFYQNGVWANDAAMGAAFAIPSKHSALLNWSNFDATFFWASDQINSDAFPGDNNAAEFFGTAWFVEANDGYWEVDYAWVHDDAGLHRSYHNFSVAFSRRYFHRVSNSVRFITNFNQSLPRDQRTAEGHLLLIENALISKTPNTFVPYFNLWYGQGATQSLARAGIAGGILNNTGINFETDGLTGYPTLDATGVNTVGGALGVNLLGSNFQHQLILELAGLKANGAAQFRNAAGDQYAVGMRYQRPLTNAWIFRTDHMFGFLRGADDIRGNRFELRFKF